MEKKDSTFSILRAIVEMGFIIFLFYSNLLMGEFTKSKMALDRDFLQVLSDIFTWTNFIIALIASFIGHFAFSFFRRRL